MYLTVGVGELQDMTPPKLPGGAQDMPPQNMPHWSSDYSEL